MANCQDVKRRTYAIVTPSYSLDFERCRLLADSVVDRVPTEIAHYIIVDRRDEALFQALRGPRTHIVVKQSILPWWLHQAPLSTRWWLSLQGPPLRGWMVQQIVKLSVDAVTRAEVLVFMDSDTVVLKPFDPSKGERGAAVPLFRERLAEENLHNTRWHTVASELLGLPVERDPRASYVTQAVTWLRSNLVALHHQIERTTGRSWAASLCSLPTMSEYVLYGVFCERLLREQSNHYVDDTITTLNYWDTAPLDEPDLTALRERLRPEHIGVMISAKSRTEVDAIRRSFFDR